MEFSCGEIGGRLTSWRRQNVLLSLLPYCCYQLNFGKGLEKLSRDFLWADLEDESKIRLGGNGGVLS